MKTLIRLLSALILLVSTYSCSNDDDLAGSEIEVPEKIINVYALVKESPSGATSSIKVWKNDVATVLPLEEDAFIYGETMYVDGADVYVGAALRNIGGKYIIVLWKNGVATPLTNGANNALIASVFVEGNDVYVGGSESINGVTQARIWKNGIATSLSEKSSQVSSIYVENGNVYVAGHIESDGEDIATLWKNGSPTSFKRDGAFTWFNALYVHEDKVYIAGGEFTPGLSINPDIYSATLWVEGVKMEMNNTYFPDAKAVFVSEGNIFVAGQDFLQGTKEMTIAQLWTNGIGSPLTDGNNRASANDIFVFNKDIYVGGYENNGAVSVAKIWKNGESIALSDGTTNAIVSSIVVIAE